jgi:hypothetical protein
LKNSEKYRFEDFTLDKFRNYIKLAKERFIFRDFENFKKDENYIIWRHDVDYSMHAAVDLARIEAEENITATYFVLLHSEFYNLLELEISNCVKEIRKAGHKLALHFDINYYAGMDINSKLEKYLKREKEILEHFFDTKIQAFSFHNPQQTGLKLHGREYADMINVYSEYFLNEIEYCSDSFGIWRYSRLEDVIVGNGTKRLQVLTHPEWWSDKVTSPAERIKRCVKGRAEKSWRSFENIVKEYGLHVIDWN